MDFTKLTELLDEQKNMGIPGIDLIVYHKGKQVYRHMTGTCDYLKTKPVSEETLYWIYSMSKLVTMTAIMQCVEEGVIGLEDPVSDYIPEFRHLRVMDEDGKIRPAENVMRVKHLMTMTGGLDYDRQTPALLEKMRDKNATTAEIVAAMAEKPLSFEPGTQFLYSLCHDVAARVLEVATGKTFGEYLKERIFQPLGMDTATFRSESQEIRDRLAAQFVQHKDMSVTPFSFSNSFILSEQYESGGAGLVMSTEDYGKFVCALSTTFSADQPILGGAALELMRAPQISDEVAEKYYSKTKWDMGYSYGLGVRTMKYPEKSSLKSAQGEFGWDGAAGSHALVDPDNEIAFVYMMQVMGCNYSYGTLFPKVRDLVYQILLGK